MMKNHSQLYLCGTRFVSMLVSRNYVGQDSRGYL